MGRILAYVLTGILMVCFVILLGPESGMPRGFAVSTLVAIGLLWTVVLRAGMPLWLRVILFVAIFCLSFVAILFAIALGVADRPKSEPPISMGAGPQTRRVAIVYHPGGTGFTKGTVMKLGEELAARGYAVSILTAHPGLQFAQDKYDAIILGSPVYAGEARPPIKEFVSAISPLTIPVFVLLTGGGSSPKEADLERFAKVLTRSGANLRAGTKVNSGGTYAQASEREIISFAGAVDESLKGN
jgi:flavodoxin